jgi:SAM-dependent methyltransferase
MYRKMSHPYEHPRGRGGRGRGRDGRGRDGRGRSHGRGRGRGDDRQESFSVHQSYNEHAGVGRPPASKTARNEVNARKAWVYQNWVGASGREEQFHASLGCGQGGDAHKLARTFPRNSTVLNVDFSDACIAEFKSRVDAVAGLKNTLRWEFECTDLLEWEVPEQFRGRADSVSCMMALHYFSRFPLALKTFFENVVYELLKPNGVFIAIYPDPLSVLRYMDQADDDGFVNTELFSIEFRPKDREAYMQGETDSLSYRFSLEGTMSNVEEHLVPEGTLVWALENSGLVLLEQCNLLDVDCGQLRSMMNIHGPVSESSKELLQLFTAIRVRKE